MRSSACFHDNFDRWSVLSPQFALKIKEMHANNFMYSIYFMYWYYLYCHFYCNLIINYNVPLIDWLIVIDLQRTTYIFRKTLKRSYVPRYLHSAVFLDGAMLVFGGNSHNGTVQSQSGLPCFSMDFLAYDIGELSQVILRVTKDTKTSTLCRVTN